jgi:N-acetylglucosamine-6-sulfatase
MKRVVNRHPVRWLPLGPAPLLVWALAASLACSPDQEPTGVATVGGVAGAEADQALGGEGPAIAAGRPNVVVIMSDDQTMADMRGMPQTQALIGAAGMTFRKNVVTFPVCCPSRATFLTGQYPHNHGVRGNTPPDGGYRKLDARNTLPVWLQAAGYVTGHIGKYLNGYGEVDSLEVPPGYTEWYGALGESAYNYYDYFVNERGAVVHHGSTPDQYQADVYTAKAADFIRRRGRVAAAGGKPFFLFVTYLAPHWGGPVEAGDPGWLQTPVAAPRHQGLFGGEVLPASPAFNEADLSDKPLSMQRRQLLTTGQISDLQLAYRQRLQALQAVDEGVARIIGALQAAGVLQNTLVLYTSDNGWFQGEHRIGFGKILPYEPAVKVPLLIRGPGVVAGRTNSAAVANVDLAPTIVATAGAQARRLMDGRSLWPLLHGQANWGTTPGRSVMVEDSPSGGAATVFWSIRQGTYVYTAYNNGDEELYDLSVDSAEVASRHADPAYAAIRRGLATRLKAMKTCAGPTSCW